MDLGLGDLGVLEDLLDGAHRLAEEVEVELLELGAGERLRETLSLEETLDVDLDAHLGRERALRVLDLALELAHRAQVLGDVLPVVLALPELREVVHDAVIEVFAAEVRVAGRREDLKDPIVDSEERDVERASAAAEVGSDTWESFEK